MRIQRLSLALWGLMLVSFVSIRAFSQSANDGFDPNVNGRVQAIALQPDGKIIVGGEFTAVGGITRSNIARLNLDGTLDPTFNPGTDIECLGCYQSVSALAVQANGKILVGGRFTVLDGTTRTNIGRLNPNGSIDPTFTAETDGQVLEMTVVAGGKILVAGGFYRLSGQSCVGIGRLNPNGSRDTDFNAGANEAVNSLAVQPDGRILIGGDFTMLGGQTRVGIGRLNANGSLDTSFNPPTIAEEMDTLALQADGKVLVGGDFTMVGNTLRGGIARLNADGSLDKSFDPGVEGDGLHRLVVQPDGKILVGGFFTILSGQACTNIGRLNPDGSLDATFHPQIDSAVNEFVVQPDGSILVGGWFTMLGGTNRNHLGRIYADGSLDTTLNAQIIPYGSRRMLGIGVQPDEKVLVCGNFSSIGGQGIFALARLSPDGSLDAAFSPLQDSRVFDMHCLLVQTDAKIVVGGILTRIQGQPRSGICRLNQDGTLDTSFTSDFGDDPNANLLALAIQPDSKLLVGGYFTNLAGYPRTGVGRLNADGGVDAAFNPQADGPTRSFAIQADGKIVVAGAFTTLAMQPRSNIARLNGDGSLDPTFNPGANDQVRCVVMQPDSKILVAGAFTSLGGRPTQRIGRLNADGSVDLTFQDPGVMFGTPSSGLVQSLALQADGKIVVAGTFDTLRTQTRNRIARLNPDGSLDIGFNPDANADVTSLAIATDGKIFIGGYFEMLAGVPRTLFGRLSTSGVAYQALTLNSSGTAVSWIRAGSAPEVQFTTFEQSTDGTNYTLLGNGSYVTGTWQLSGLSFPSGISLYVRARGRVPSGYSVASSGLIESVAQFWRLPPPFISSVQVLGGGAFQFSFTNTNAVAFSVLASSDVAAPAPNWENLGAPRLVGNGLYQFTDPGAANHARRFYQLRSP